MSPEYRARHPEIPWKGAIGMRQKLVHGYDDVNLDVVWQTIQRDIPQIRDALHDALASEIG